MDLRIAAVRLSKDGGAPAQTGQDLDRIYPETGPNIEAGEILAFANI